MDVRSDEAASGTVEAVGFSILSAEEIRGISVKKITKAELLDVKGTPVPDGLCDPAMGPTNDRDSCKSCGQLSLRCPGHCGHIDLVRQVYNPVLFDTLCRLLKTMCMFCGKFKMKEEKVELYVQQLELVLKGHIGAARNLADSNSKEEDTHSDASHLKQKIWTSLQQIEATSIVEKFLKERINQCQNCNKRNPKIKSPMPGMINMAMEGSDTRANVISDSNLAELNELIRSSVVGEELRTFKEGEESLFSTNGQTTDASMKSMSKSKKSKSKIGLAHKLLSDTKMFSGQLLPPKVGLFLEELWKNESKFCSLMCDLQQAKKRYSTKAKSHAMFMMDALLVPPNKFRPTSMSLGGRALEHPQNVLLVHVLEANNNIINNNGSKEQKVRNWMKLQERVNVLFDSSKGFGKDKETTGLRQLLEKKAGILRQKMMGKRVNFACRSVISPDPYLAVNEIGIPPQFALKLTYPERVTPWNVNKLRQCIMNGPEIHPGASNYKDRESLYRLGNREARASSSKKLPTSRGTRGQVGNGPESEFEGKIVYRHLDHGDIVLANRQPTLHKISMMALVARVITGEKTLRMHYANCSSMNADFDGDEMNVHLPQDEISRSEAINVVNANRQYVLPASGKPVRGLIQDHIVGAVLLTKKDTFLTRDEYHELLYSSVVPPILHGNGSSESTKKVLPIFADREIQPVFPSILKPVPLWTGKQVVTAVLNHVSGDRQPFTVKKAGKITKEYLEKQGKSFKSSKNCVQKSETVEQDKSFESSEGAAQKSETFNHNEFEMLVYKNELLHGMIDKEQFGLYGLVHTVHELYGPNSAGILLSMFSRLFTVFLQMHGFTCGVDDLLIVSSSNDCRRELLETCEKKSEDTHLQFVGIDGGNTDPLTLQAKIEEVLRHNGEAAITRLDRNMSSALNHITSLVNDDLVPGGLLKPFTRNCVSLMTATGAKGSSVNFNQISSLLGQQELEGKRVPRMVSGKTLPCFPAWDIAPRAGGFVSDRFLTGLRPQEYYFHCMAGREGLVDTAIKTSRSGYLQRCLVKNLESLKVCYDFTVRDVDGSVVQFVYGEDGIDVHQTSFLNQFEALASNSEVILEKLSNRDMGADLSTSNAYLNKIPPGLRKKAEDFHSKLTEAQRNLFQLRKRKKLMKIMQLKYLNSLVQPGEAVGVLASQSLGEQTTQMTLNTFHLAGRGDVNVTLGIPRLQEILMNAKEKIKTPVMVCPLREGKTEKEAEALAAKLSRISVADIIESMEVCVVPFCISGRKVATVFKLKMKLYPSELYPADSDITLESCHATLNAAFVVALDAAINKHLNKLSRIRGIKVSKKVNNSIEEDNEDESRSKSNHEAENDDGSDDDDEVAEDQGADAQKRKKQACDEVEYDDDIEDEKSTMVDEEHEDEEPSAAGFESEVDNVGGDLDDTVDVAEEPETSSKSEGEHNVEHGVQQESGANYKGPVYKQKKKKLERVIKVETRGLEFEVHFDFTDEPHILLAEIAQRTAKSVYVKQTTDIEHCTVNVVKGKGTVELKTAGVHFPAFWDLSDDLDINRISSNDIWAMLWTYGVEAARGTIIKEVNDVFKAYGIAVDIRHLFLIADFMTFDGDYRAMNRGAMTTYGTSPFGKITFETATKFAVEAAFSGEVDRLEAPSASICLGQPVKMGTGSFDLLQNL